MTPSPNGFGDDANRFLSALAGGGVVTFQTFDDTPRKRREISRIFHGPLSSHADKLGKLNTQGAGIYVMANQGDCKGRKAENVKQVRALFVDLDGSPLAPVLLAPIQPHITVESSPGKYHAYWLVNDIPLSSFKHIQQSLAKRFNSDPKVCDLPRVMRLPGFYHNKNGAQLTKLLTAEEAPKIAYKEFLEAFEIPADIPVGQRNDALFKGAAGFHQKGIPKAAAHARIAKMNETRCEAPLPDQEVEQLVEQAYSYPVAGKSMIPNAFTASSTYDELSPCASKLLFQVMLRSQGGKPFSLPHPEFSHMKGMSFRQSFRAAVQELIDVGLIEQVRNYVSGSTPEGRQCALYQAKF